MFDRYESEMPIEFKTGIISVIVPIYNVEKYILKCLKSISEQTYKSLEVILVNDGSTDNSGSIAETFAKNDERFIYILKKNGGLSSARNEGLKYAKGEYIYFLDSDDWIQKDYLEVMVKEFDQETDIVVGKYTLYDSTLGFSYVPYESEKADYIFEGEEKEKEIVERHLNAYPQSGYILKNTLMPVWKNLYRHQMLYDNNIFFINERIVGAEDYVFNFEAYYHAKKIKLSSSAGYVHQIVEGSLSRQYHSDSIERGFNKCEVIRTSIESKSFFHKKAILYALKCEKLRIVLGSIYSIALSNSKEKVATIKRLLSDSRVIDVLDNVRRPNLENKYRIIFALLRFGGVKVTCAVLNMVGKKYKIYRKLEYRTRN